MSQREIDWQRRAEEIRALDDLLEQLYSEIKASDETELPAIIRRFEDSPLGARFRGLEEVAEEIRECYCAEKSCGHTCTYWACTEPCDGKEPGYCEDCFAFVPNLLTFCHCGQTIMASWAFSPTN